METKAKAKFIRTSPRKIRLVADLIRGLDSSEALTRLKFTNKAAALILIKLINSAVANAEENYKLKKDNLFIKEIKVDGGPTLDRWMPRAFGRATPIRKRTSHVNLILAEKVPTDAQEVKKIVEEKKKKTAEDIVKISDPDEIQSAGKEGRGEKSAKEGGRGARTKKGFANKLFNRRSGER